MEASSPRQPFYTPLPSHILRELSLRSFGVVAEAHGPIQDWNWASTHHHAWCGQTQETRTTSRTDDAWEAFQTLLPPPHRHLVYPHCHPVFAFASLMSASSSPPVVSLRHDAPVLHPAFLTPPPLELSLPRLAIPSSQDPFLLLVLMVALPLSVAVRTTLQVHASSWARPYVAEARDPPLPLPFRHRRLRLE